MSWLKTICTTAFCTIAFAPCAISEEAVWHYGKRTVDVQLSDQPDFQFDKVYVIAQSQQGPTLILSCSERFGLSASILLGDVSIQEVLEPARRRVRARSVSVYAGEAKPRRANWAYERRTKSLQTVKQWQAARIYNAVVTGNTLHLDIERIGKRSLSLPAIDDDFRKFNSGCPAT